MGFLPLVGFWMLPLGLALLADDVPLLRWLRSRILDWIEHRHPHWIDERARNCAGDGGLTTEEAWARVMEGYNEKKSSEAKRATLIEQRTT